MHSISIQFSTNETNNNQIATNTNVPKQKFLVNSFRSFRFKKYSIETNKKVEASLTNAPVKTVVTAADFKLSSLQKIRNFNSEIILIKKEKSKLDPIDLITINKKTSIENKLNDFLKLQQIKLNKFNPDKNIELISKEFRPSFVNDFNKYYQQIKVLKQTNKIDDSQDLTMSKIGRSIFPKPNFQTETTTPLLKQGNNFIVKGLFVNKDLNQPKSTTTKPKLTPIKLNSKTNVTLKPNITIKSEDDFQILEIEPVLNKSQRAYSSAVASSSQLLSYSKLLNYINDETSSEVYNQDFEFIKNQKQVPKLFRAVSSKMRERTSSGKYKNRINIKSEIEAVDAALQWPDSSSALSHLSNNYKFFERNKLFYLNKIKPVKIQCQQKVKKENYCESIFDDDYDMDDDGDYEDEFYEYFKDNLLAI